MARSIGNVLNATSTRLTTADDNSAHDADPAVVSLLPQSPLPITTGLQLLAHGS